MSGIPEVGQVGSFRVSRYGFPGVLMGSGLCSPGGLWLRDVNATPAGYARCGVCRAWFISRLPVARSSRELYLLPLLRSQVRLW
jgi:hypothetical protein